MTITLIGPIIAALAVGAALFYLFRMLQASDRKLATAPVASRREHNL